MAAGGGLNPIAQVTAEVVAADPELRERVRRLANSLLRDAEHTVKFGSPAERAQLMKAIVPGMLRTMQTSEGDAMAAAERAAYERLQKAMRGEVA